MFLNERRVVVRFCPGEVFCRQFLPGDQQLVRVRELPDQPAVPVPRRLALPEVQELLDLPPEAAVALAAGTCLAQVKDDGGVHPFGGEGGLGQRRVLLLEDARGALLQEAGLEPFRRQDGEDACTLRDPHGLERPDGTEAREPLVFQALSGELHSIIQQHA